MALRHLFAFAVAAQLTTTSAETSTSNLRSSPAAVDAKLEETVRALDTNGNGKVDQSELAGFAQSQGLSSEEVLADFKELDVNNDGALDSSEIGPLFGAADATSEPTAKSVDKPPLGSASAATAPKQAFHDKTTGMKQVQKEEEKVGLDLAEVEHDAQDQAEGVIASRLAQRAQVLLARSVADEQKALVFDGEVRTLRGNATALAQNANEETRKAARLASASVAAKSMQQLRKLQEDEQKSEVDAEKRREEATRAMGRVRKAQAALRTS